MLGQSGPLGFFSMFAFALFVIVIVFFPFGVQGPVVQSIFSLKKSLVEHSLGLTMLTKSFVFTIFQQKHYCNMQ